MSSRVTLLALAFLCTIGCGERRENEYLSERIIISSQDFEALECLTQKDSLFSISSDSGKFAFIEDGYICLLQMKEEARPLILEIRDSLNGEILYKYDSSQDKLIMPLFTKNGTNFTIYDNLAHKILNININEAINNKNYHPHVFSSNIISERITPWGDRLLFLNPNSYENENERVCVSKKNWSVKEGEKQYNSANVIHGELICSPDQASIAYVPYNFNTIELFNTKQALIKEIALPHETTQGVANAEIGGEKMYFYMAPLVKCFSSACAGKTLFAAGFIDDIDNNYLLIFDWEGKVLKKIRTKGRIRSLSIDSQDQTIYSWERHEDTDILFSYRID